MLKTVLWIAAACAAVLVALAVSRGLNFDRPAPPEKAAPTMAVEAPAVPAAAIAPEVVEAPPPPLSAPMPDEQQIQDDAAATGMTTVEPDVVPAEEPPT